MGSKYDVVVVGSGVGGLGAAALLAKDFGKKVLVLEKNPFIGGRMASFVGKGDKVTIDGLELDLQGFKQAMGQSKAWLGSCKPDIETIFKESLLDGYTFENGGHGLFWGNKGRVSFLLDYLNRPVDIPVNTGLGYIDFDKGNKFYQVGKREPYQWMTEEGYKATYKILREMGTADYHYAAANMHVSLKKWMDAKGMHPEGYDYLKHLAAAQTAMAEPEMTPAGDYIAIMAMAGPIKMNLITGSVATVANPGTIAIPQAMEEVVVENGGKVMRDTPVEHIIVSNGKARAVVIRTKDGVEVVDADAVICNLPPKEIFNIIHPRHLPADFVSVVQKEFWSPGLLTAFCGMSGNVWEDTPITEESFTFMPGILRDEGYIGDWVDMTICSLASWAKDSVSRPDMAAKGRAPEGKTDFLFSTALTDAEMRDPAKVTRLTDWCDNWCRRTFPKWKEYNEFIIWTPSDEAYGHWRPVGTERPDVKCPWIEDLFFVGDQYGARNWSGGVEGASLSAVLCVDSIMDSDLEEKVMPFYHRGLPTLPDHW